MKNDAKGDGPQNEIEELLRKALNRKEPPVLN